MKYRRVVVKVGTYSICGSDGAPSLERIAQIGSQIVQLMKKKVEVVLVSSGSIGTGARILLNGVRPQTLALKQACAAVGQPVLMSLYRHFFQFYGIETGQILITGDVITHRERFLNARNTFFALLQKGVLPVVNENDSVAVDEIKFGDNDNLAVHVAAIIEADACFILSDIEGLYRNFGRPDQELLSEVEIVDEFLQEVVEEKRGGFSTGGMSSKLDAAKKSAQLGFPLIILPGYQENVLIDYLFAEKKLGTTFYPGSGLKSRKKWLFINFRAEGDLYVDEGAQRALARGKSLLPVGIVRLEGAFQRGDVVNIRSEASLLGKGMVNYSSEELLRIYGQKSEKIENVLGYSNGNEAIHRDNLILMT